MDMIGFKKLVLPALPGLDVRKADVELFSGLHGHFFILLFFCFFGKRKSPGPRLISGLMSGTQIGVSTSAYMFFSGHLFETIWYLRRSSHFQPSDRWRPLLDDAFAKVAANSVSHGVTSGQQGRKSPSPQICASPCVSAVMCNSCPATHSRKMTRDEPGISAGPPREPAGPPGTAIDFFW